MQDKQNYGKILKKKESRFLRKDMKICKKCIQPDSRPGIYFDENGVCGACLWEDEKKIIDWEKRYQELEDISKWAKRSSTGNYDCAIGVSGGKDSTKQALTARDQLGLRCLLVNSEPSGITDIGKYYSPRNIR